MVSLIITSYKRSNLLKYQLESISKYRNKNDLEIIVVNDGLDDDTKNVCELYGNKLNIKYLFTGQRNTLEKPVWRTPSFAINIGVKKSTGDIIILSCAEMYHFNNLIDIFEKEVKENNKSITLCQHGFIKDDPGEFLSVLNNNETVGDNIFNRTQDLINSHLPFIIGIHRNSFVNIGGYDEDFIGVGYDDNDIMERLVNSGCAIVRCPAKSIHIFHERVDHHNIIPDLNDRMEYNKKLYESRNGVIVRNVGREWGKYENI